MITFLCGVIISLLILFVIKQIQNNKYKIKKKYEDVHIISQILEDASLQGDDEHQIVDTSLYMKNKIIGLISFVSPQKYKSIEKELTFEVIKLIKSEIPLIEIDQEQLKAIRKYAMEPKELFHATVVQFRNGEWKIRE